MYSKIDTPFIIEKKYNEKNKSCDDFKYLRKLFRDG
jgi:hypothetical protein